MKKIILSAILVFILFPIFAQSSYDEAIQQGDDALQRTEYITSIKKYLIAEKFDQSKWKDVQEKLDKVYAIIGNKHKELESTILNLKSDLKLITAQKEKLEGTLASTKEEIGQIERKLEDLESQVSNILETIVPIITQANELKNSLLQIDNNNNDK